MIIYSARTWCSVCVNSVSLVSSSVVHANVIMCHFCRSNFAKQLRVCWCGKQLSLWSDKRRVSLKHERELQWVVVVVGVCVCVSSQCNICGAKLHSRICSTMKLIIFRLERAVDMTLDAERKKNIHERRNGCVGI